MRTTISKLASTAALALAIALTLSCSSDNGEENSPSGGNVLDGIWQGSNDTRHYQIKISDNDYIYSDAALGSELKEIIKGIWSANSAVSAPSTGIITCTVTYLYQGGAWQSLEGHEGVTNTANYELNSAGNVLTISNAASAGGLFTIFEGTYQKQ